MAVESVKNVGASNGVGAAAKPVVANKPKQAAPVVKKEPVEQDVVSYDTNGGK